MRQRETLYNGKGYTTHNKVIIASMNLHISNNRALKHIKGNVNQSINQ